MSLIIVSIGLFKGNNFENDIVLAYFIFLVCFSTQSLNYWFYRVFLQFSLMLFAIQNKELKWIVKNHFVHGSKP